MNPIPQPIARPTVDAATRLALNSSEVASKEIDGEALIMNVSNGMYYSLDGSGAVAWNMLAAGHSVRVVTEALAARFDVDPDTVLDDVLRLARTLLDENLVSVDLAGAEPSAPRNGAPATGPYAAPRLNKYSDMADLLALDPPMPSLAETSWIPPEEG